MNMRNMKNVSTAHNASHIVESNIISLKNVEHSDEGCVTIAVILKSVHVLSSAEEVNSATNPIPAKNIKSANAADCLIDFIIFDK